jgi:prevent-host-death family protein
MKTTQARQAGNRAIGVRDAKAQLSRLLQDVQRGGEWTITERGKPIARLVPIAAESVSLAQRIRSLEQAGIIEPVPVRRFSVPPPLPVESGLARRMLDSDRNGRA